jgi:hypothetical protein
MDQQTAYHALGKRKFVKVLGIKEEDMGLEVYTMLRITLEK